MIPGFPEPAPQVLRCWLWNPAGQDLPIAARACPVTSAPSESNLWCRSWVLDPARTEPALRYYPKGNQTAPGGLLRLPMLPARARLPGSRGGSAIAPGLRRNKHQGRTWRRLPAADAAAGQCPTRFQPEPDHHGRSLLLTG